MASEWTPNVMSAIMNDRSCTAPWRNGAHEIYLNGDAKDGGFICRACGRVWASAEDAMPVLEEWQQDEQRAAEAKDMCRCGWLSVSGLAAGQRLLWYGTRHSREECVVILPDDICWCGLRKSEHRFGHQEDGATKRTTWAPSPMLGLREAAADACEEYRVLLCSLDPGRQRGAPSVKVCCDVLKETMNRLERLLEGLS